MTAHVTQRRHSRRPSSRRPTMLALATSMLVMSTPSWGWRLFQSDERDLKVAGLAHEVHDFHHLAVRHSLVGTQEDAGVLLALGGGAQCALQLAARHRR